MGKVRWEKATVIDEHSLGVQEASAVAVRADGRFLVADDEQGIFLCSAGGDPRRLEAGAGLADLEGLCFGAGQKFAYTLTERDGGIWRFSVDGEELTGGVCLGKLPRLNKRKNHGWEGITYAAPGIFGPDTGGAGVLVAVHQANPRVIGWFDAESLELLQEHRLPKAARKVLGELNDVALHPTSKRLFVLSGRKGKLGELTLQDGALALVRVFSIDTFRDDVPEGCAFDAAGRFWVVTDGEGSLRELSFPKPLAPH